MEKKFIDKKKDAEKEIHGILESFKKDTGVAIHFVDFSKKSNTGFNTKEEYTTKIMLKND